MGHVNAENHSKMRKSSGVNGSIKSTFEITTEYHTHTHPPIQQGGPWTGISFFGTHVQNDKKKVLTLTFKIEFVFVLEM